MTVYLTGGNYVERTENVLRLMRDILAGHTAGSYSPIHGVGSFTARFNIYTVAAFTLFFIPLFLLVPLGLFLTSQAGPILAWGLATGLSVAWIAWLVLS